MKPRLSFSLSGGLIGVAAALLLGTLQTAEAVVIYPTPQHNGTRSVTTKVTDVKTILRTPESSGGMWERLPNVPEGYAVDITPGKLTVYANDETGLYYARQSIIQMLYNVPNATLAHNDEFVGKTLSSTTSLTPYRRSTTCNPPPERIGQNAEYDKSTTLKWQPTP